MKFKWAAVAAILVLASGCHKETPWQVFSPAGGSFSVLMPGAPVDRSHEQKTTSGTVSMHLYIYTTEDTAYAVSYVDRPAHKDASDGEKWLETVRDTEVAKSGGTLLSAATLKLGNTWPGRELQVRLRQGDGKRAMRDRLFLVNNRLYQVLVVLPEDKINTADTGKFIDSFQVH